MIVRWLALVAALTAVSVFNNVPVVAQAPAPAPAPQPTRPRPSAQPSRPPAPAPTPAPQGAEAPPPPPPAPPAPTPMPAPRRENQSTNIRVEVTITDQRPSAPALTKTVSVVTGDGLNGSVRSQTNYRAIGEAAAPGVAPFNVDAWPTILADGKVHVRLTVQYDVVPPAGPGEPNTIRLFGTSIRDSVALILESGKPVVAVQSTDPVSDRKVSIEVRATILK